MVPTREHSCEKNGDGPLSTTPKIALPTRVKWNERTRHWESAMFANTYPFLFEFLTRAKDDDGHYRAGTTLLFMAESDQVKCCLNDRATGNYCFLSIEGDANWLTQIEENLAGGVQWRESGEKKRR